MWSGWSDQKVDCDMWSDLVATCDQILWSCVPATCDQVALATCDQVGADQICQRHVIRFEAQQKSWRKRKNILAKTCNFNWLKLKKNCKINWHWNFICLLIENHKPARNQKQFLQVNLQPQLETKLLLHCEARISCSFNNHPYKLQSNYAFYQSCLTLSKLRADWITYRQRKKRACGYKR